MRQSVPLFPRTGCSPFLSPESFDPSHYPKKTLLVVANIIIVVVVVVVVAVVVVVQRDMRFVGNMRRGINVTGGVIGAAQGIESHVHLENKYPNDEDKFLQS